MPTRPDESEELRAAQLSSWLQAVTAVALVSLLGATPGLWFPSGAFPLVPLISAAATAPAALDRIAAWGMLVGLVVVLASLAWGLGRGRPSTTGFGWLTVLISAIVSVVLDQHRWQPWLSQFAVLAAVFVAASPKRALTLARLLTISLYLHSALGKLDRSFLETHGPSLVDGLLANFGAALPDKGAIRAWSALALPAGELLAGALLAFRPTRRCGLALSLLMHAGLMAALGPAGLNHRPGVLLWNAFFVVQNLILFGPRTSAAAADRADLEERTRPATRVGDRVSAAVVWLVVLVPFLEPFGLDPWLAWGLYSSRPARLQFLVREADTERLPDALKPFVEPAGPFDAWRRVRIDRWSLAATGAPIAPQLREQVGVVLAVCHAGNFEEDVRVVVEGTANRWTGRREVRVLSGQAEIERFARTFRLNSLPRAGLLR